MRTVTYEKSLPVKKQCDILVVGGGPAGVAAAHAAALAGARVLLLESGGCLGGMGTQGLVPAFMQFTDGVRFLAGNMGKTVLEKMNARSERVSEWDGVFSISLEALKRAYDDILSECGAEILFLSRVVDVVQIEGEIESAVVAGKSGIYAVKAKVYIDATGDGDLAVWGGAAFQKGDENGNLMAATLCSLWSGIHWDAVRGNDARLLGKAIQDGIFTQPDRHLPGMFQVGRQNGGGNIGHLYHTDGTDEHSMTLALLAGRRLMDDYKRYYKEYLAGFEDVELVATANVPGIRETRRIAGEYCLTLDDFLNRAGFDDEIGRYAYPVDIHASNSSDAEYALYSGRYENYRYKPGESYGIPYRALIPQKLKNLLVAGRCISTDRYMQSSVRVMPCCFITGQAAGAAAALAVKGNGSVRDISVPVLQNALTGQGVYITRASAKAAE